MLVRGPLQTASEGWLSKQRAVGVTSPRDHFVGIHNDRVALVCGSRSAKLDDHDDLSPVVEVVEDTDDLVLVVRLGQRTGGSRVSMPLVASH